MLLWYSSYSSHSLLSILKECGSPRNVPAALVLAFRLGRALYAAVDLVSVRDVAISIGEAHAEGQGGTGKKASHHFQMDVESS